MAPPPPDLDAIAVGLREVFPDAEPIAPCRLIDIGFNSVAVETAGGAIFRIARTEGTAERYAMEGRLLPLLAAGLPVAVPHPLWIVASAEPFPLGTMGYLKLAGVPLSPAMLTPATLPGIAADVVSVLLALHRVPLEELAAVGLPNADARRAHLVSLRDNVLPALRDGLDPAEFRRIKAWWEAFLADRGMERYEPVLCHGDFWFANILVDDGASRVTAVVDWEHAALGDPALDFSTLLHLGEEFATATLDAFRTAGGALDGGFTHRMRRLWELREFYGVLYAVRFDDETEMRDSIAKLRHGPILGAR